MSQWGWLRGLAWVPVAVLLGTARAQDTPATITLPEEEPAAAQAPAGPPTEIEEIIVTATKQDRVLRDIPASISVVDGAQLDAVAAQEMDDVLKFVPGVNLISQDVGATKVTIRGITSELGTAPTTGILYGDVSFTDAFFPFVSLDPHPFDMQGVEVLKGPQGTLFGAAALNGAVRYVPQPAELGRLGGKYFLQVRQLAEGETVPVAGGALNLPLQDFAALRLVLVSRDRPGFIDDTGRGLEDVNTGEQLAGRALLAWEPAATWRLSASYVRQDTQYDDEGFADNREGRLERSNTPDANPRESFYDFVTLGMEVDLAWAQLVGESALVRKRFDQDTDISRIFTGSNTDERSVDTFIFFDSDTVTHELRLVSNDATGSPWSWVGGVFYSDQPIESGFDIFAADSLPAGQFTTPLGGLGLPGLDTLTSEDGQPLLGRQRSDVRVTELAAFGELSRTLGTAWELALGLRAYRTDSGGIAVAEGALYGGAPNVNEDEIRESGLNPKLSLSWRPDERWMGYALVSRGFRVGGIQPTASSLSQDVPSVFESDTIWNAELGVRSNWLQRSLQLDLTAYHEIWQDALLAQLDPNNPNPVAYYYDNVAEAESSGLEGALRWRTPLDGLSLDLSAAYNRTVTSAPFTEAGGTEIVPGTPWPFAPRWQTVAGLSYLQPLFGGWDLRAGITHSFTSEANTTLLQEVTVYDYALTDLQVALLDSRERWPGLTLTVGNLFDERGISQDTVLGDLEEVHDVVYTRPRTIALMLSGRF